jgi:N-acetylglutamate synthase-like GNAT family acetyltransferase
MVVTERKVKPWKAVSIRVAKNEHGASIRDLLTQNGVSESVTNANWNDIFPYWLISVVEGEVVGCVLMVAAKPYGFLEFLCVKPGVSNGVRAVTVKKLLLTASQQLKAMGSSFAMGTVYSKTFKNVLKNNGCVIGPQCNLTVKWLGE